MADEPIDFSPLDPDADRNAAERSVASVMARVRQAHEARLSPAEAIASSAPRTIAAAVVVAVLAMGVIASSSRVKRPATIAESIGIPAALSANIKPDAP